jgi:hypothetical protein
MLPWGLQRFDATTGSAHLGEVWTVAKQGRTSLTCIVRTHPLGWELQIVKNRRQIRSQVCQTHHETFEQAAEWLVEYEDAGFRQVIA